MFLSAKALQSGSVLCGLACIAATIIAFPGCQFSDFDSAVRPMLGTAPKSVEQQAPTPVSTLIALGYRTSSDQINAAAASAGKPAIPPAMECWLQVLYPHPQGVEGKAQAILVTQPLRDEAAILRSTADRTLASPLAAGPYIASQNIDIEGAEAAAVLSDLRNRKFFQRSGISTPTAYIAVAVEGNDYGRAFENHSLLDQLVLKCWHEGTAQNAGLGPREEETTPATQEDAGRRKTGLAIGLKNLRRLPAVE